MERPGCMSQGPSCDLGGYPVYIIEQKYQYLYLVMRWVVKGHFGSRYMSLPIDGSGVVRVLGT